MALEQIVYISKATFSPQSHGGTVEPEVGRILVSSRKNNPKRGIVGALHYADGFFFQVLEGEPEQLDELFPIIEADPRHSDVKVLGRESISRSRFNGWSMKYGAKDEDVRHLLKKHGLSGFNPYAFDAKIIADLLSLLQTEPILEDKTRLEAANQPQGNVQTMPSQGEQSLAKWALGIASLALLLGVIALARTF